MPFVNFYLSLLEIWLSKSVTCRNICILNSSDDCRRRHFCGKYQFRTQNVYIAKNKTHFETISDVLTKDYISRKPSYMMNNNDNFQLTRSFRHKIKGRFVVFIDLLILRPLLGSNEAHLDGLSFSVQISDNAWWRLVKSSGITSNFVIILGSTFLKFLCRYMITQKSVIMEYTYHANPLCKECSKIEFKMIFGLNAGFQVFDIGRTYDVCDDFVE